MIVVWFSCGAASAVAAKLTLDRYGASHEIRVVNNPVLEEDEDNRRFSVEVASWLGVEIEDARCAEFPAASAVEVWEKRRFMSGVAGAPCTMLLKKRARQEWQAKHQPQWHVLGFTADEKARHDRFVLTEIQNVLPVLIDAGMSKEHCYDYLLACGIQPPRVYAMGYPNANCIGCVKATSPTYWNHVRQQHPTVFAERAEQSRRLGARLVRVEGKRMFLDELDPAARGRSMKSMTVDCGIFCEEPAALAHPEKQP